MVIMSVKRYSEITGIDIEARILDGKDMPTQDETLASVCKRALVSEPAMITPDEIRAFVQKEREYDELEKNGELPEKERSFRESRAGKQWRITLDALKQELDESEK